MTAAVVHASSLAPRWRTVVFALLLYVAFLLATAPAALLSWGLSIASGGIAALERPEGSIWRGEAAALQIDEPSAGSRRYERIRWEWIATRLMSGEVAIAARIEDPSLRGSTELSIGAGRIRLRNANFEMPVSALGWYQPRISTAGLSGMLRLDSPDFAVRKGGTLEGAATVLWSEVGTSLSSVRPLGNFLVHIVGAGNSATFKIESFDGGPLRVTGEGTWSHARGISFAGSAQVRPGNEANLDSLLKLLGPQRGNGIYAVSVP